MAEPKFITITTWNIGGGRKINSLENWDYSDEDLNYIAENLIKTNPDIVLLQETLESRERVQAEQIAKLLGFSYFENSVMSPDHVSTGENLCCSIISKTPITNFRTITQPYPDFELIFKDGRVAQRFDKFYLLGEIDGVNVVTTQLQPLHYWGYKYTEGEGGKYAKIIADSIVDELKAPLVLGGDLQFGEIDIQMPKLFADKSLQLKECLPDEITRVRASGWNTKSDHILASKEFEVVSSEVVKTMTDHYMGTAKLQYN
ncbi:endonuclease/exonuclease/phosphatase family protein [candidate division WWE3 bacterium]|nr:endonuclease/exonuclease/phosphatase family protein [candidate division WWE3 bacterium]